MKRITLLCIITFSALSVDAVKFRCDYTFHGMGWFKYHDEPQTFEKARNTCQLEGGVLASPTTQTTKWIMTSKFKDAQQNKIRRDEYMLTGINSSSRRSFKTDEGISLGTIPHVWKNKQSDNDMESNSCIVMNDNGELADVGCNVVYPYLCFRAYRNEDVGVCGTPDREYRYESRTKKCYKFHHKKALLFDEAQYACSAEGGHLAIINSDVESTVLREIFQRHPNSVVAGVHSDIIFIGFYKWGKGSIGGNPTWVTVDGQTLEEAGFAKFSPGQPDNWGTGEHCGSLFRNGLLNDMFCTKRSSFICEKSPHLPPVCDS